LRWNGRAEQSCARHSIDPISILLWNFVVGNRFPAPDGSDWEQLFCLVAVISPTDVGFWQILLQKSVAGFFGQ